MVAFYNLHRRVLQILFLSRSAVRHRFPFEDSRSRKLLLIDLPRIVLDHLPRLACDRGHFRARATGFEQEHNRGFSLAPLFSRALFKFPSLSPRCWPSTPSGLPPTSIRRKLSASKPSPATRRYAKRARRRSPSSRPAPSLRPPAWPPRARGPKAPLIEAEKLSRQPGPPHRFERMPSCSNFSLVSQSVACVYMETAEHYARPSVSCAPVAQMDRSGSC